MRTASPGAVLRDMLQGPQIVVLPGVFNALTALQACQCGAGALYLSGAGVSNTLLGTPDIGLITLTEMASIARHVCRAANAPVLADADTGYGEAMNVVRTVEEMEQAGLAGIHLEDQTAPKRCGHLDGKQVVSVQTMQTRIRAAVRARKDPAFLLVARTDARAVEGVEAAVARAEKYLEAGADAIFPEGLQSAEEFALFASRIKAPLLANMTEFGKTPLVSVQQFEQMGYAMVIFPMTALRVMMFAARALYTDLLQTGTQQQWMERMQTRNELYALLNYARFTALDEELASMAENEKAK